MIRRFIEEKVQFSRLTIVVMIYILLLSILLMRLYTLQIVEGETYSIKDVNRYIKERSIPSVRGTIYDRNGNVLATNRMSYSLVMTDDRSYASSKEKQMTLNGAIYRILKVLTTNKEELNKEFYIELDETGKYVFTVSGARLERFKADVYGRAKVSDMKKEELQATPEEILDFLASEKKFSLYNKDGVPYSEEEIKKYGVSNQYTKQEELDIITYRYMLSLNAYKKYNPITIAMDVSEETAAYVLENQDSLGGMDIEITTLREYEGGEAFSHILGYTGKVSEEELETLSATNADYTSESMVGKTGIEKTMESILHGKNGVEEFSVNQMGQMMEEPTIKEQVVPGSDVYLSIDKDLQIKTYEILERQLADILLSNIINAKTFDKSKVKEASEIRIPIYDVYVALFNNNIVDIERLQTEEATEFEREIGKRFTAKKARILERLFDELDQKGTSYNRLDRELQEYQNYIAKTVLSDQLEILDTTRIDKTNQTYVAWSNGESASLREYLLCAIEEGWIDSTKLIEGEAYYNREEIFDVLVLKIMEQLLDDIEFDKLLYKELILSDHITGKEVARLLYEQGVLSKKDKDYEALIKNQISAYQFFIKKIDALEITPAMLALDPYSASAVVVDPNTGSVLACVSYPGYDNNKLANKMDSAYYNKLYNDLAIPMYNRATQQLTAPGSTFKPVTIIAGLKESVISYGTSVFCDGVFNRTSTSLRCWKRTGHGTIQDIAGALAHSCNDYLGDVAFRLGQSSSGTYSEQKAMDQLTKYAQLFDLDKKSGVEIVESEPQVSTNYAIASSIGQGTHNFSTVQLARYAATLANQGTSYDLSLIHKVVSGEEETVHTPEAINEVQLSSSIWKGIGNGLRQFAEQDSNLKEFPISVAGKTGTAQEAKNRPDHALFVGYAPAENPEISVAVRIANGYKSANAVKATKNILSYYFNGTN